MESELKPLPTWDMGQTWGTFTRGTFHQDLLGVEVQKSADDLLRYKELIDVSQPDVVIETGTRAGGSAIWFNQMADLQVITIDIVPAFRGGVAPWAGRPWKIESIRGSSINDEVVKYVLAQVQGKRVMVSLDSDHHSAHVQAEMTIWSKFVSPGCYMVVEDACFDLFHRAGMDDWARVGGSRIPEYGGTLDAIEKSGIALSSRWWRDEELEGRTAISHSPVGYWRKHE